jgi:AcrR family transcriptional regulator
VAARPAHVTREALLDAGVELLAGLSAVDLVAAMRTREIARRAGVSPPTFFHHFRTVEEYARALVDHVYSSDRKPLEGVVTDGLREARRLTLPAEQSIAYHTRDLLGLAADPEYRLRTGLWALGGATVDERYGGFLREVDRQLMPQAQALHDGWGREVRPPLDLRSYLAVQIALVTGSVARHLADPTVMTPERYARAAAALSMVMLRPKGDRRTMDDRLSEMNYAPGPRTTGPVPTEGDEPAGRRDVTRARLIDAAAELFGEYGYEAASITRLARTAGVHVATLYEHFGSKAHLALALFDRQAAAQLESRAVPPGGAAADRLRRHLSRVAAFVATHSDLARLYLSVLACGDQPRGLEDVLRSATLELVAAVLSDDGRQGSGDDGLAAERAADQVLVATIGAVLRHPGDGSRAAAVAGLRYLRA